ncbi:MAG: three-Cys-motif partner protein TcmP [Dysgonamonadaceae bacterium]|jgi:three-Cys-motif partner protein|nr:three-Cys-motif partner protein TcmP [Dysgonamonadaceae bacterium]
MAIKDLHKTPFDEGTITKLEIFENYAKEWLPTFIVGGHKELWIFDFFAGTGYDINSVAGSPIRILQQVKNQSGNIFQKKTKINICFNEFDKQKFGLLQQSCNQFVNDNSELLRMNINLQFRNSDFAELFPKTLSTIRKYPSLVYLDQNGVKFLADKYIDDLEKTTTTDFLCFLSSSYVLRFGNTTAFQSNLKIDIERAKQNPYKYIHKSILEQLREKLPPNTKLSLYPFTIKKNANVYGIIFGATHPRAVDKFLKTAWKKNSLNGEANFDIDDDVNKNQLDLFEKKKLNKIESFKQNIRKEILEGNIKTNKEAYDYTLKQGHISNHATEEIEMMKKEKLIHYAEKSPLINYEQVYKNNRIINYQI